MSTVTADASKIIEGSKLMVWNDGHSIAHSTNHTLTVNAETSEISSKDIGAGTWASSSVKKLSWEITTDNLYTKSAYAKLYQQMIAKQPVTLIFGTSPQTTLINDSSYGYADWGWMDPTQGTMVNGDFFQQGQAIITSLDTQAPNDDNATFSATFQGIGELSIYISDN